MIGFLLHPDGVDIAEVLLHLPPFAMIRSDYGQVRVKTRRNAYFARLKKIANV